MSGRPTYRSQHEAARSLLEPLNQTVSCVTTDTITQVHDVGRPHRGRMSFRDNATVPLLSQHGLGLRVLHVFETTASDGRWTVSTRSCLYTVFAGDTEIIAFHRHPGRTRFSAPHAHFRNLNDPFPMGKAHIPTGRISLESVVRMLVDELGVRPARPASRAVLERTERQYASSRSWH